METTPSIPHSETELNESVLNTLLDRALIEALRAETFERYPRIFQENTPENAAFSAFARLHGEARAHACVDDLMNLLPTTGIAERGIEPLEPARSIRIRRHHPKPLRKRLSQWVSTMATPLNFAAA